ARFDGGAGYMLLLHRSGAHRNCARTGWSGAGLVVLVQPGAADAIQPGAPRLDQRNGYGFIGGSIAWRTGIVVAPSPAPRRERPDLGVRGRRGPCEGAVHLVGICADAGGIVWVGSPPKNGKGQGSWLVPTRIEISQSRPRNGPRPNGAAVIPVWRVAIVMVSLASARQHSELPAVHLHRLDSAVALAMVGAVPA